MIAEKIAGLLAPVEHERVLLVGGTVRNTTVLDFLPQKVPEVVVPEEAPYFEALGAALAAFDRPRDGDRCILGLDVGSTSTKAVPMRRGEHSLLASVYLRGPRAIPWKLRGRASGASSRISVPPPSRSTASA